MVAPVYVIFDGDLMLCDLDRHVVGLADSPPLLWRLGGPALTPSIFASPGTSSSSSTSAAICAPRTCQARMRLAPPLLLSEGRGPCRVTVGSFGPLRLLGAQGFGCSFTGLIDVELSDLARVALAEPILLSAPRLHRSRRQPYPALAVLVLRRRATPSSLSAAPRRGEGCGRLPRSPTPWRRHL